MQKYFPGFYPLEDITKEMMDKATIVLDTDVLLDLFRLYPEDAECFVRLLNSVKDNWTFIMEGVHICTDVPDFHSSNAIGKMP